MLEMTNIVKVFHCLLFLPLLGFANVPTVEGLFRNNNNKDFSADGIFVSFTLNYLDSDASETDEKIAADKNSQILVEMLLASKGGTFSIYQRVTEPSTRRTFYKEIPQIHRVIKKDLSAPAEIFYSTILSLAANDGDGFKNFLLKEIPDFKSNRQLLNFEKVELLRKYRNFLKNNRGNESKINSSESPLKSDDNDRQSKINELLNSPMYVSSSGINLIRELDQFFWFVNFPNFEAKFENETRRLAEIKFKKDQSHFEGVYGNYILYNGSHELPAYVKILINEQKYRLQFRKHFLWGKDSKNFKAFTQKADDEIEASGSLSNEIARKFPVIYL
jgi:hypothetical protein